MLMPSIFNDNLFDNFLIFRSMMIQRQSVRLRRNCMDIVQQI